jgi:hypothetical protein
VIVTDFDREFGDKYPGDDLDVATSQGMVRTIIENRRVSGLTPEAARSTALDDDASDLDADLLLL